MAVRPLCNAAGGGGGGAGGNQHRGGGGGASTGGGGGPRGSGNQDARVYVGNLAWDVAWQVWGWGLFCIEVVTSFSVPTRLGWPAFVLGSVLNVCDLIALFYLLIKAQCFVSILSFCCSLV